MRPPDLRGRQQCCLLPKFEYHFHLNIFIVQFSIMAVPYGHGVLELMGVLYGDFHRRILGWSYGNTQPKLKPGRVANFAA